MLEANEVVKRLMEVENVRSEEELDYRAIIRRVLDGERDAFTELVQAHESEVFAMLMRQVGNRDVAEELSQETFIKAYRFLASFKYDARFSTWLIRIALNTSKTYFSSKRFKQSALTTSIDISDGTSIDSKVLSRAHESKEPLAQEAQIASLRRALGSIKAKYRDVIVLHIFEGKSYVEISEILQIPKGTIGSRMNYAVKLLRKEMQRLGNGR